MSKREEGYQKRTRGEVGPLLAAGEQTAYGRMAARLSQERRTRNANALARARSVARLSKIR